MMAADGERAGGEHSSPAATVSAIHVSGGGSDSDDVEAEEEDGGGKAGPRKRQRVKKKGRTTTNGNLLPNGFLDPLPKLSRLAIPVPRKMKFPSASGKKKRKQSGDSTTGGNPAQVHQDSLFRSEQCEKWYEDNVERSIVQCRFVNLCCFDAYGLSDIFGLVGLMKLNTLEEYSYPLLVRHFYANLEVDMRRRTITTRVNSKDIEIDAHEMAQLLECKVVGVKLQEGRDSDEFWQTVKDLICYPGFKGTAPQSLTDLNDLAHVLGNIISYNIVPKAGSRGYLKEQTMLIIYNIMRFQQVDWIDLIFSEMDKMHKNNRRALGYANLITAIYMKKFGNFDEVGFERIPKLPFIDTLSLSQMHLGIKPRDAGEYEEHAMQATLKKCKQKVRAADTIIGTSRAEPKVSQSKLNELVDQIRALESEVRGLQSLKEEVNQVFLRQDIIISELQNSKDHLVNINNKLDELMKHTM